MNHVFNRGTWDPQLGIRLMKTVQPFHAAKLEQRIFSREVLDQEIP